MIATTELPIVTARRRRFLQKLAYRVQPELADAPLYLVGAPLIHRDGACVAFRAAKEFDLMTFAEVEKQIGWQGPGVAIVFCVRTPREKQAGTLLHELAHPGETGKPNYPNTPEAVAYQSSVIAEGQQELRATVSNDAMNWFPHHHLAFHRRALHLHHRAWRAGYAIGLPQLAIAGWFYGLSPAWRYMRAIGDEPRRMIGKTLAEIDASEPPEAFRALWESDTAAAP